MDSVVNYSLEKTPISQYNVAFVLKPNTTLQSGVGYVGAYIPKFMSEIDMKDGPYETTQALSNTMIKNSNIAIKFNPVQLRNYYNLKPYRTSNMEQPPLGPGERFMAVCLEGDVKNMGYTSQFSDEAVRQFDRVKLHAGDGEGQGQYHLTMDTKDQVIKMESGTGQGEKSGYSFTIDGKQGNAVITDTNGQALMIDSTKKLASIANEQGVKVEVIGSNINIIGQGTVTITCPNVVINGNVQLNGSLSVTGNMSSTGSLSTQGGITSAGTIIDINGNTNHHTHP
jgi:phage baseplate assembly protein gpV